MNSEILKKILLIKKQYPELSKFIEEMPITIPDETNPEITLRNLTSYSDSLYTL